MEGKVTVFFGGDGRPAHVVPMGLASRVPPYQFACGEPAPWWWLPRARHQCEPAKLVKKIVCRECRFHVQEVLKGAKKPAKKKK